LPHRQAVDVNYDDHIEIAQAKLGIEIAPSPFHSEFTGFADLAFEVVEAEALTPDAEPAPDDAYQPGDRVRVDARMPSGDTLRGTGTVVRCLDADETVIVTMDEGEGVEPWSYSGRTVSVDAEYNRAGVAFPVAGRKVIDACHIFHQRERRDLTAAYKFYCGLDHEGAHGAAADVLATLAILDAQVSRYDDLPRTIDGLHEHARTRRPWT